MQVNLFPVEPYPQLILVVDCVEILIVVVVDILVENVVSDEFVFWANVVFDLVVVATDVIELDSKPCILKSIKNTINFFAIIEFKGKKRT